MNILGFKTVKQVLSVAVLLTTLFVSSANAEETNYNEEYPHLRVSSNSEGGTRQQLTSEQKAKIKENIVKRYHAVCLGREATAEEIAALTQKNIGEIMSLRKSAECNTDDANARRAEYIANLKAQRASGNSDSTKIDMTTTGNVTQ